MATSALAVLRQSPRKTARGLLLQPHREGVSAVPNRMVSARYASGG